MKGSNMTKHYGEIWHWTFRRSLAEQNEAYVATIDAMHWRDDKGYPMLASQQQRKAAYHHKEMRIRLERLLGLN